MLIDTLTQQHNELLRLIRQLDLYLARADEAGVRATLSSLDQALQVHLSLEDREMYPGLLSAAGASGDARMLETVKLFSSNMHRITESLQDFLARHVASFHLERFRACWTTLSAVLVRRIQAEEQTLYPLYERHASPPLPPLLGDRSPFAGAVLDLVAGERLEATSPGCSKTPQ